MTDGIQVVKLATDCSMT